MYIFTFALFDGRVDNIANKKAGVTVVAINLWNAYVTPLSNNELQRNLGNMLDVINFSLH